MNFCEDNRRLSKAERLRRRDYLAKVARWRKVRDGWSPLMENEEAEVIKAEVARRLANDEVTRDAA